MKSFATKVVKSSQKVTSFGGISYVNDEFTKIGYAQLIVNANTNTNTNTFFQKKVAG